MDRRKLVNWHNGEGKADYIDSTLEHFLGHLLREPRVAQYRRDDRMVRASQREARLRYPRAEAVGIGVEPFAQRVALFDQIEHFSDAAGSSPN